MNMFQEDNRPKLDELAKDSGGKVFPVENGKEIDSAFDFLAAELRHQYLIGFKPSTQPGKKKWRQVKIKMTPSGTSTEAQPLQVRSRDGYYAAENQP
jgi:Ca-activated chloride channel family protein